MIRLSQPIVGAAEAQAAANAVLSGQLAQGPGVTKLEKEFARFCDVRYAVAVSSGTTALHCALCALGIEEGDEVITTPFSFVATANAILMQGALPVFVDIDFQTFNLDSGKIEAKISKGTKAILPVDLFGHPYDVDSINSIAEIHSLKVVEDACQAHGTEFKHRRAGSLGDIGCFSFYATKNMTTGEGGMITTDDEQLAAFARALRHHGQDPKTAGDYIGLGYNYRLTDFAAAIGVEQLKKLESFLKKRRQNALAITQGLEGVDGIITPSEMNDCKHAFNQYVIRITKDFAISRDDLIAHLRNRGIETGVYYARPLHLHPQFLRMGYAEGDFPITETACNEVLSLPVHPLLKDKDINRIVEAIREV